MKRAALVLLLLPALAYAQATTRPEADSDLVALCDLVKAQQARYHKANGWYMRCIGPGYKLDGCARVLGTNLARAQAIGFHVTNWRGNRNGDGDGASCSATFGTEERRLTPTKRAGRDGKAPTTNHRAAYGWRAVAVVELQ